MAGYVDPRATRVKEYVLVPFHMANSLPDNNEQKELDMTNDPDEGGTSIDPQSTSIVSETSDIPQQMTNTHPPQSNASEDDTDAAISPAHVSDNEHSPLASRGVNTTPGPSSPSENHTIAPKNQHPPKTRKKYASLEERRKRLRELWISI